MSNQLLERGRLLLLLLDSSGLQQLLLKSGHRRRLLDNRLLLLLLLHHRLQLLLWLWCQKLRSQSCRLLQLLLQDLLLLNWLLQGRSCGGDHLLGLLGDHLLGRLLQGRGCGNDHLLGLLGDHLLDSLLQGRLSSLLLHGLCYCCWCSHLRNSCGLRLHNLHDSFLHRLKLLLGLRGERTSLHRSHRRWIESRRLGCSAQRHTHILLLDGVREFYESVHVLLQLLAFLASNGLPCLVRDSHDCLSLVTILHLLNDLFAWVLEVRHDRALTRAEINCSVEVAILLSLAGSFLRTLGCVGQLIDLLTV